MELNELRTAALLLEQKYTNTDNSSLLNALGVYDFSIADIEQKVAELIAKGSEQSSEVNVAAIFALGKTFKSDYRTLYIEAMQKHMDSDISIVYQAGIAIENLGERVFYSYSPIENKAATKEKAKAFLSSL